MTEPSFEPLRQVSLCLLSFKVLFLIAITSARRISELAALSIRGDLCIFHSDKIVLRLDPTFLPKVNSTFHRAQELVLPNFCPQPSHRWNALGTPWMSPGTEGLYLPDGSYPQDGGALHRLPTGKHRIPRGWPHLGSVVSGNYRYGLPPFGYTTPHHGSFNQEHGHISGLVYPGFSRGDLQSRHMDQP